MRGGYDVEAVRGRLDDALRDEILTFWRTHGALTGDAAVARLPEVVGVLRQDGVVVGVNSAFVDAVGLIGNRRFWIYRRFFAPGLDLAGEDVEMINLAFDVLQRDHVVGEGPVGLCVMIGDPTLLAQRPEAVWPETGLLYAGYDQAGQQIRIRYFEGAVIA